MYTGQEFFASFQSNLIDSLPVVLKDINGVTIFLPNKARLVINEIVIVNGATAQRVDVIAGDTIPGDDTRIIGGNFAANGGVAHRYAAGRALPIATLPFVVQSAADVVDVFITGCIVRG